MTAPTTNAIGDKIDDIKKRKIEKKKGAKDDKNEDDDGDDDDNDNDERGTGTGTALQED